MSWLTKISQIDSNIFKQMQLVRSLLEKLGFDAAAADVNANNVHRYASWVINEINNQMYRIDPVTRKRTEVPGWKKMLEQTEIAFALLDIYPVPGEHW